MKKKEEEDKEEEEGELFDSEKKRQGQDMLVISLWVSKKTIIWETVSSFFVFLLRGGQMLWAVAWEITKRQWDKSPDSKVDKIVGYDNMLSKKGRRDIFLHWGQGGTLAERKDTGDRVFIPMGSYM